MSYRNPISGEVREISWQELLDLFDKAVHDDLTENINLPYVDGMVMFENLQMDSSAFGSRSAMIFGPGCTYTTAENATSGWLHDLPSQRQYPKAIFLKKRPQLALVADLTKEAPAGKSFERDA